MRSMLLLLLLLPLRLLLLTSFIITVLLLGAREQVTDRTMYVGDAYSLFISRLLNRYGLFISIQVPT